MRGEGEPSASGTSRGDLHVYVHVAQHPLLGRRDDEVFCQVPISFAQAALGGKIAVPTLAGEQEIDVPPGTQSGEVIVLKQMGLPSARNGRKGDQLVQVFVEVPKKLTPAQRELLAQFAKTEEINITPQRKNFFDRLKEHFAKK